RLKVAGRVERMPLSEVLEADGEHERQPLLSRGHGKVAYRFVRRCHGPELWVRSNRGRSGVVGRRKLRLPPGPARPDNRHRLQSAERRERGVELSISRCRIPMKCRRQMTYPGARQSIALD